MVKENVNKKAILDVYKNAHIALQSLKDLIPEVEDKSLRAELDRQYAGYDKFINEVSAYLKKKKITPKDINVIKKTFMWTSIKMKTLFNSSRNQIAEMMIKGTVMGIIELSAMKNEKTNYNEEVTGFIDKLLALEEEYEQKLKTFL